VAGQRGPSGRKPVCGGGRAGTGWRGRCCASARWMACTRSSPPATSSSCGTSCCWPAGGAGVGQALFHRLLAAHGGHARVRGGIMDAGGNVPLLAMRTMAWCRACPWLPGVPFHSQLATGALFGNPSLARKAGVLDTRTVWLLGADACSRFDTLLLKGVPATRRTDFPEGGVRAGEPAGHARRVPVADAGPLGLGGVAAHGHADALSFTLSVAGRQFLIDPGTGTYHGPAKWRHGFRGAPCTIRWCWGGTTRLCPGAFRVATALSHDTA
jgi:hypothetical protein